MRALRLQPLVQFDEGSAGPPGPLNGGLKGLQSIHVEREGQPFNIAPPRGGGPALPGVDAGRCGVFWCARLVRINAHAPACSEVGGLCGRVRFHRTV